MSGQMVAERVKKTDDDAQGKIDPQDPIQGQPPAGRPLQKRDDNNGEADYIRGRGQELHAGGGQGIDQTPCSVTQVKNQIGRTD